MTEYVTEFRRLSSPNTVLRSVVEPSVWHAAMLGGALAMLLPTSYAGLSSSASQVVVQGIGSWIPPARESDVKVRVDRLSSSARQALGQNAARRFDRFLTYQEGWDGGRGHRLSAGSVAAMEYFLSSFSDFRVEPSLFLTITGNLQLSWDDPPGREIDLDFLDDGIIFYIESRGLEDNVPLTKGGMAKITHLIKDAQEIYN